MSTDAQSWLREHNEKMSPMYHASALSAWNSNVTGDKRDEEEAARAEAELRKFYSNREEFERVRAFRQGAGADDPVTARQLTLAHNSYLSNQMDPKVIEALVALDKSIEAEFNKFRAKIGDREYTDNELKEVLRKSTSSEERRAAWEASKQVGVRVADKVRELARMRNAEARRLGFRDYFAMSLELQELDEARLFETFARLYELSEAPFTRYKAGLDEMLARRCGVKPSELAPWHYSDPFFQEAPAQGASLDRYFENRKLEPLAAKHFAGLGLEVEDILARSDLYEKPGKCQHAFCITIDRADDVRVLCNLVSNQRWMDTLLHELGHAVYDKYIDRSLPFLLRSPAHTLSTEAIAMLNGRCARNDEWLAKRAGVPEEEARALGAGLRRFIGAHLLILTRWVMVMTSFERDLYANPGADLNATWWGHVRHFQKLTPPDRTGAADWASKIHIATAPVYYQNYLLGEMMASQLAAHISKQVSGGKADGLASMVDNPGVGEFLRKKVFGPGALYSWEDHLRHATGEGLNPQHFVAEYA